MEKVEKYIFDKGLSLKAKGILTYLAALGESRYKNMTLDDFEKDSKDGRGAFRSGWKELENRGIVERVRIPGENGKVTRWETIVRW